jgi:hypothetical protein
MAILLGETRVPVFGVHHVLEAMKIGRRGEFK